MSGQRDAVKAAALQGSGYTSPPHSKLIAAGKVDLVEEVAAVEPSFQQLRDGHDFLGVGGITFAGAADAQNADIEGVGAAGEFAADRAISHDQQALAVQLGEALRQVPQILLAPAGIVLIANGIGKIARE